MLSLNSFLTLTEVEMIKSVNHKFSKETLEFLAKAGRQKKPDWLDKNSAQYEEVLRKPFIELAEKIKSSLKSSAVDYHFPSKGLARIKRPDFKVQGGENQYKDWISMIATRPAKSRFDSNPHLFFGLFPNEKCKVLLAGGLYQPTSQQTRLIREAISKDSEPFRKLFADADFKGRFKKGFSIKKIANRVPRGFDENHADILWIKLKNFVVIKEIPMKEFTSKGFSDSVVKDFKQALRLNRLLDLALQLNWPPESF